jgi:surface protein
MKEKIIILLLIILFMPVFVKAAETCNPDDVKITSIELNDTRGNIEEVNNATGDNNKVNLDLKMNVPGDTIEYKLVLTNTSESDYEFDEGSLNIDKDNVNYEIVYDDDSNIVGAGQQKAVYLRVSYKNKIEATNLNNGIYNSQSNVVVNLLNNSLNNPPTGDKIIKYVTILIVSIVLSVALFKAHKSISLMILIIPVISLFNLTPKVIATCKCSLEVESNITIDEKEAKFLPGQEVNVKMKKLSGDDTSTNNFNTLDYNVVSILKSDIEPLDINKEEKNVVSTSDSPYPIYMWFDNGTIYWWSEDKTPALNEDASYMLYALKNIKDISGVENFDLTNTSSLKRFFCSSGIENVTSLTKWNTSNITNISDLFYNSLIISADGIENWNTSNVEDMSYMFSLNIELNDVSAIKNWNVSKVKKMNNMFSTCFKIEEIDLSNWETKSLEQIRGMFSQNWVSDGQGGSYTGGVLKRIILSEKFDTSKVEDMDMLFYNNRVIEKYEFLKYIDTSNVKSLDHTFFNNNGLKNTYYVKDWDVSKVENMYGTFIGTKYLTSLEGLKNWNTSNVKNMGFIFRNSRRLTSLSGIEDWDVSNVTDYSYMFDGTIALEETDFINEWDINSTANYTDMFTGALSHPEFTKVEGTWNNGTFIPNE